MNKIILVILGENKAKAIFIVRATEVKNSLNFQKGKGAFFY